MLACGRLPDSDRPGRRRETAAAARARRAGAGAWSPRGALARYRPRRWTVSEHSPCPMVCDARSVSQAMVFRPFLFEPTACASYLFGCLTHAQLALVDPHVKLVDRYFEEAERLGAPIGAVFETHVQADHVSGLSALVEVSGATAYLPAGAKVDFDHVELGDGEVVELGNTLVRAVATPGHAPAHNAYVVSRQATRDRGAMARLHRRLAPRRGRGPPRPARRRRILSRRPESSIALCTGCSSCPTTSSSIRATSAARSAGAACPAIRSRAIGFERRHNAALAHRDEASFANALLADLPPAPADQQAIVAANRRGSAPAKV